MRALFPRRSPCQHGNLGDQRDVSEPPRVAGNRRQLLVIPVFVDHGRDGSKRAVTSTPTAQSDGFPYGGPMHLLRSMTILSLSLGTVFFAGCSDDTENQ